MFRRGPSRQVLLIAWNTRNDSFQYGQWLKGKIYERRCDLSPDGHLLLYFAANFREPYRSWSAISKPPFLTALALWPKGDAWGGGGLFLSRKQIALNHRKNEMSLAKGFSLPKWLSVGQFGERPGWGEDDPLWAERLMRDGWTLINQPGIVKHSFAAKVWFEYNPPLAWRKPHPISPKKYSLEMAITGVKETDGPWYLVEHTVIRNDELDRIGRSDWADWSRSGDLLFAMDGCLYRVPHRKDILAPLENATRIADFSGSRFEAIKAPGFAQRWPSRK